MLLKLIHSFTKTGRIYLRN